MDYFNDKTYNATQSYNINHKQMTKFVNTIEKQTNVDLAS